MCHSKSTRVSWSDLINKIIHTTHVNKHHRASTVLNLIYWVLAVSFVVVSKSENYYTVSSHVKKEHEGENNRSSLNRFVAY